MTSVIAASPASPTVGDDDDDDDDNGDDDEDDYEEDNSDHSRHHKYHCNILCISGSAWITIIVAFVALQVVSNAPFGFYIRRPFVC